MKLRDTKWAALALIVLAVAVAIFGPVTDLIAKHDTGTIIELQSRNAIRGQLLQLGAGLFVAAALVYIAREFARNQQRRFRLSEQGQVTDRYTRAIEQLGSAITEAAIPPP